MERNCCDRFMRRGARVVNSWRVSGDCDPGALEININTSN